MIFSVMLTFFLFTLLMAGVFLLVQSDTSVETKLQGSIFANGSGIMVYHVGGDPIPASSLQVKVFINRSISYSPAFTLLNQSYAQDTDGKWNFGDRLLLEQNVSAGSSVETVLVDQRTHGVIGRFFLQTGGY